MKLNIRMVFLMFGTLSVELRLLLCFSVKLLELTNFHEGFREALPYWLNKAFSTTQDRVERAVQVDQVTYCNNITPSEAV